MGCTGGLDSFNYQSKRFLFRGKIVAAMMLLGSLLDYVIRCGLLWSFLSGSA
jgi:hypothetical protein